MPVHGTIVYAWLLALPDTQTSVPACTIVSLCSALAYRETETEAILFCYQR